MGSSPLTRGAPNRVNEAARPVLAHPRSRGEHVEPAEQRKMAAGSSPLTRGARPSMGVDLLYCGLIPAHAGSTSPISRLLPCCGAHPRSRGEHVSGGGSSGNAVGSSPLTRGALTTLKSLVVWWGLIPAHAGSTRRIRPQTTLDRAHPRSRGEHSGVPLALTSLWGSSPLTRGARIG